MKFLLILALVLVGARSSLPAADLSFWVWQRTSKSTPAEVADWQRAGVKQLYWQVGTILPRNGHWFWREQFPLPSEAPAGIAIIPVVRIETPPGYPLTPQSTPELIAILNRFAQASASHALQIDYEAPDRLIPAYLTFLQHLKEGGRNWRLSISALGHWSKYTAQFTGLTDEITPMFYDLDPGREVLTGDTLPPLVDETAVTAQLAAWKNCPVPWKAGLPNFSRVTVLDSAKQSRGNIHAFSWDELWFSPLLGPPQSPAPGETIFPVAREGPIARTPLQPQEEIVARYPDRAALARLQLQSLHAGAQGVIYFRLADAGDASAYGVLDLAQASYKAPTFAAKWQTPQRLVLTNTSASDLMPSGRGYALEVQTATPVWREVIPGDFAQVSSNLDLMDWNARPSGLVSTTLYFWFSHLRAGQSLTTGLVERTTANQPVRWRIHPLESESTWHSLD